MPDRTPPAPAPDNTASPRLPQRRARGTRRSVIVVDRLADWLIRIGGLGVIIAVFAIMVFLAQVVAPLFAGGYVVDQIEGARSPAGGRVLTDRLDEYHTLAVAVSDGGEVRAFHVATGRPVEAPSFDFGGARATAFARTLSGNDVAFGFADGTVRFGQLKVDVRVLPADEIPAGLAALGRHDRTDGKAIYSPLPGNQVRRVSVSVGLDEPQKIGDGAPIAAMDYRLGGTVERPSKVFATVDAGGVARLSQAETRINLLTGQARTSTATSVLPALPAGVAIVNVLITDKADQLYVADRSGTVYRYDTRDFGNPRLAESAELVGGGDRLTLFGFLNGEQSLVVGSSRGAVDVYFRLQRPDARTGDGFALVRAHALEPHGAAATLLSASQRSKMFVTADADGNVWVRHSTSEQTLMKLKAGPLRTDYEALVLAPREDGVLAIARDGRYHAWGIDVPHPETTIETIFGKVWYEGYGEPTYTWQSSAATDSFEPKLSLVPLIFGTLKATFYSLLFAVPIALGAAIYTSEFVHARVRSVVKPMMEMMASLPSVVLGFIAALILAPFVETWLAAVITGFVAVPLGLFVGAYLWQLVPAPVALRYGGLPKFLLMFLAIGLAAYLGIRAGPAFESLIFAGDVMAWANGDIGSDGPFMLLLLLPPSFVAVEAAFRRVAGTRFHDRLRGLSRGRAGLLDMGRWLAVLLAAVPLAYLLGQLLGAIGLGARGGIVDTYVQRNTLVVGFAMGFAVIPIIYTIAEDALNAVPEHLRAASLACGASPWQTAVAVILPTALSGVFAAVMIGMGRAVGETMIVVMAAGNTPLLEWNIFNGLRALSANIAVELPEAVRDSTLYRMLFLAALCLFVMTFAVNTVAEMVRQRFRKRAAQM